MGLSFPGSVARWRRRQADREASNEARRRRFQDLYPTSFWKEKYCTDARLVLYATRLGGVKNAVLIALILDVASRQVSRYSNPTFGRTEAATATCTSEYYLRSTPPTRPSARLPALLAYVSMRDS